MHKQAARCQNKGRGDSDHAPCRPLGSAPCLLCIELGADREGSLLKAEFSATSYWWVAGLGPAPRSTSQSSQA